MISVTPSLFVHKIPTFFFFTTTTATTRRSNPSFPAFSVRSSSGLQGIVDKSQKSRGELGPELFSSAPLPATKEAKRVVLVRHGQSTWNEEGRIQGSSDFSVLTKKGEAQAETSRQMLIDDSFDVCFSSPLIRSKRTAEIIWGSRNEEIITESDLREIDLYSFQGLLKHEGKAKFGAAYRQWQVDAPNFNIDGHYPVRELWARARNFWTKLLAHESKSVLVVAHNAVNQALVATAIGLGTGYFRVLLQSNCGVSVLDFTPRVEGGSPFICLNRLNQNTALQMFFSGGRSIVFSTVLSQDDCDLKPKRQVHLCLAEVLEEGRPVGGSYLYVMDPPRKIQRFKRITRQASYPFSGDQTMNMLGVIQSQKTAELLLDLKVSSIISSPKKACVETAMAISSVQEAADCLGADCVPRYVEMKRTESLDVESFLYQSKKDSGVLLSLQPDWLNGFEDTVLSAVWDQSEQAWEYLLKELPNEIEQEKIVVVVGDPSIHIALMGHCLNLTKDWMGSFHLDAGSISVIDFPDGLAGRGVIRCINYTAHLGRWSIPITRSTVDDEEF